MARVASFNNSTGELTVTETNGTNADGSPAVRQWTIPATRRQLERHRGMFAAEIAGQLSPGDRSAINDAIAEHSTERV